MLRFNIVSNIAFQNVPFSAAFVCVGICGAVQADPNVFSGFSHPSSVLYTKVYGFPILFFWETLHKALVFIYNIGQESLVSEGGFPGYDGAG